MNKSFIISDEKGRGLAVGYLNAVSLAKPLRIEIKPYKKNRSADQNKLMWLWFQIIGDDLGYTKDEVYFEMTELYLPLELKSRFNGEKCPRRLGTSDLNTKEFTEFLNNVEIFAAGMGIVLPKPEDLMWAAMGVK